jgi:hypothetical protein
MLLSILLLCGCALHVVTLELQYLVALTMFSQLDAMVNLLVLIKTSLLATYYINKQLQLTYLGIGIHWSILLNLMCFVMKIYA